MVSLGTPLARFLKWVALTLVLSASVGCDKNTGHPWVGWWTPGDTVENVGYHPVQPVPTFSHKLHAGDRQIPCQYCHSSARRSQAAGIPSLNTCMGCHKVAATDRDPIKFITKKYEAKEPLEWTRVHDLPDFVRFTHQPHIQAGVDCSSCHGNVKEMTTVQQVAPLQMGWCTDCHIKNNAPTSCATCHY